MKTWSTDTLFFISAMLLYTFKGLSPFVLCDICASGMYKKIKRHMIVKNIKCSEIMLFDKFGAKKS